MADFLIAHKRGAKNEGGYSNVTGDTGGETYAGVARRYHPNWTGWAIVDKHRPLKRNDYINDPKLKQLILDFYKKEFWDRLRGDEIKFQAVADEIYDDAINTNHTQAVKKAQRNYGLPETGRMSQQLLNKLNNE